MAAAQGYHVGPRGYRVLVCGGRDFGKTPAEREAAYKVLDALHAVTPIAYIVHGNCRGADGIGKVWAFRNRPVVKEIVCPADWARHGKRAGPIRNQNMLGHLTLGNAVVLAFPGGSGTRDMVKRARRAGFTVIEAISPEPAAAIANPPGAVADDLRCEHGDADCACLARNVSRSGCLWSFPAKAGDQ